MLRDRERDPFWWGHRPLVQVFPFFAPSFSRPSGDSSTSRDLVIFASFFHIATMAGIALWPLFLFHPSQLSKRDGRQFTRASPQSELPPIKDRRYKVVDAL